MKKHKLLNSGITILVSSLLCITNVNATAKYETTNNPAGTWNNHETFVSAVSSDDTYLKVSGLATDECTLTGNLGEDAINKSLIIDTVTCSLDTDIRIAATANLVTFNGGKLRISGDGTFTKLSSEDDSNGMSIGNTSDFQIQNSDSESAVLLSAIKANGIAPTGLTDITGASLFIETEGNVVLNKALGLFTNDKLLIKEDSKLSVTGENAVLDVKGTIDEVTHNAKVEIEGTLEIGEDGYLTNGNLVTLNEDGVINNYGEISNASYSKTGSLQDTGTLVILGTINNYNRIIASDNSSYSGSTGSLINYANSTFVAETSIPEELEIINYLNSTIANLSGEDISFKRPGETTPIVLTNNQVNILLFPEGDDYKVLVFGTFGIGEASLEMGAETITSGDAYDDLLKSKGADQEVIGAYEVTTAVAPTGKLIITFNVGTTYAGKTITILHLPHGEEEIDKYTAIVNDNGYVSIEVDSLSPFMLLSNKTVNPKTGDNIVSSLLLSSISILAMVSYSMFLIKKKNTN